jgi:hypothetical protein
MATARSYVFGGAKRRNGSSSHHFAPLWDSELVEAISIFQTVSLGNSANKE